MTKKTKTDKISVSLKCELIMTNDHLDSFESDKYVCNALNVMAMFCIDVDYYPKWQKKTKKKNLWKMKRKNACSAISIRNVIWSVEYGVWMLWEEFHIAKAEFINLIYGREINEKDPITAIGTIAVTPTTYELLFPIAENKIIINTRNGSSSLKVCNWKLLCTSQMAHILTLKYNDGEPANVHSDSAGISSV